LTTWEVAEVSELDLIPKW